MKVQVFTDVTTGASSYWLWCPGCDDAVRIDDSWQFDGNPEQPTFSPSILSEGAIRCHSFLRAGMWEFLPDSDHALAGKTVPMVDLPAWLVPA
jgi:hypothetical protein